VGEVAIVRFVAGMQRWNSQGPNAILVSSKGGMSSLRVWICQLELGFPEHGELPDLVDVLKCMAIECEAVRPTQVLNYGFFE
jgi:hypothetical protein